VKNLKTSIAARNAQLNALGALADSGYLRIYAGSQPANPETPASKDLLLAELRMAATAFTAARDGEIKSNRIADEADAKQTGKATWYRLCKSDGRSAIWDGSVGTADADLVLDDATIKIHARVSITSLTYSLPE